MRHRHARSPDGEIRVRFEVSEITKQAVRLARTSA